MVSDNPNFKAVNTNPKLTLQNGLRTKFSCLKCRKNLKPRKLKQKLSYTFFLWDFGWGLNNEPKTQENLKYRKLKSGFCQINQMVLIHLKVLFWHCD
jgi:hypothetical protein